MIQPMGSRPKAAPYPAAAVAVMAQALARANAEPARQKILVDALVALGRGDGWGSTRANAAALFGLAQFLAPPFEGSRPRTVAVRVGETRQSLSTDAAQSMVRASGGCGTRHYARVYAQMRHEYESLLEQWAQLSI